MMAATILGTLFLLIIIVIAGLMQAAFMGGILTALLGFAALIPADRIAESLDGMSCNQITEQALTFLASENRYSSFAQRLIADKIPDVAYYEFGEPNNQFLLLEGIVSEMQVTIVDLSKIPEEVNSINMKGPVITFFSDINEVPAQTISISSESLVSFCQEGLNTGKVTINSPLIVLDHSGEDFPIEESDKLLFPWGDIAITKDLGIYTFGQIKDVIHEMVLNKKIDSLVDISPGISFQSEKPLTEETQPEFEPEDVAPSSIEVDFKPEFSKDCGWFNCDISVDQEEIQKTVSSLFESKGGAIESTFVKSIPILGSAEFKVIATNPIVEFVETDGVEKLRTTVDLVLSTNHNLIQTRVLEGQTFRAVVESNLIYDDDTWRFYSNEPKVVNILFAEPNRTVETLRTPLINIANSIAEEVLQKVPVFDLDKSSAFGTDIAGYLLKWVKIKDEKLVIRMGIL